MAARDTAAMGTRPMSPEHSEIPWSAIRALTFDCYGTLVDWETGLAADLRAGLAATLRASDEQCLRWYADAEPRAEAGPFRPYRDVLRAALVDVAQQAQAPVRDPDALVRGLPHWPIFEDTTKALRALQSRFKLCVCSNVDRDLFDETEKRLGVRFDEVVTADEIRSYKPAPDHWKVALRRLQLAPQEVAHVAQSLYHDIGPATALSLRTVWVDRRSGRAGGATPPTQARVRPSLRVTSLAELVSQIGIDPVDL